MRTPLIFSAIKPILLTAIALFLLSCEDDGSGPSSTNTGKAPAAKQDLPVRLAPEFNPDSAFHYLEQQLAFGPRVPNTGAHSACADWLADKLEQMGAKVSIQTAVVDAWNLDENKLQLNIKNIIASFVPESKRRIMLSAHWDTRPFADAGPDETKQEPIPGANDGASGVAVLLEIARHLGEKAPGIGVDIMLWDAEDHGVSSIDNSYCLGSQYWSQNPHQVNYRAMFGINLDMVGGNNAYFRQDPISRQYAGPVVDKVWLVAAELGYGQYFPSVSSNDILDDHVYLNFMAQIPYIDIIDLPMGAEKTFFPEWHTLEDDLSTISKATLKATGQTVMEVVYREK